jgi:hypothetical protein
MNVKAGSDCVGLRPSPRGSGLQRLCDDRIAVLEIERNALHTIGATLNCGVNHLTDL